MARQAEVSNADQAAVWSMSGSTNQPGVREAPDQGRAKEQDKWGAKLRELAMDGTETAVIFALKARHAYREGEASEGGSTNVQVNINLPSAKTSEEY